MAKRSTAWTSPSYHSFRYAGQPAVQANSTCHADVSCPTACVAGTAARQDIRRLWEQASSVLDVVVAW